MLTSFKFKNFTNKNKFNFIPQLNNQVFVCYMSKRFFLTNLIHERNRVQSVYRPFNVKQDFYWNKHLALLLRHKMEKGWRTEGVLKYRKNNTQFLLSTPKDYTHLLKLYTANRFTVNEEKQKGNSKLLWSLTVGQVGFTRCTKKTVVAAQNVATYAFWFFRRAQNLCSPILFKTQGTVRQCRRHKFHLASFLYSKWTRPKIYALQDDAPIKFGDQILKHHARKRYRFHLSKSFNLFYKRITVESKVRQFNKKIKLGFFRKD